MSNLILTRKAGQSVKVGESMLTLERVNRANVDVTIDDTTGNVRLGQTVTSVDRTWSVHISGISRGQAKLTFTADRSVTILRTELIA